MGCLYIRVGKHMQPHPGVLGIISSFGLDGVNRVATRSHQSDLINLFLLINKYNKRVCLYKSACFDREGATAGAKAGFDFFDTFPFFVWLCVYVYNSHADAMIPYIKKILTPVCYIESEEAVCPMDSLLLLFVVYNKKRLFDAKDFCFLLNTMVLSVFSCWWVCGI